MIKPTLFPLGDIYLTATAAAELELRIIILSLIRHGSGDWGDCCSEDKEANDVSLIEGSRLLSVYHDPNGVKFWIITEHDRSATTILLPEDY